MTVRILGACLIIIGCGACGYIVAATYKKETAALAELIDILVMMECELQYRCPPVGQILLDYAMRSNGILQSFCLTLSEELSSQIHPDVNACVSAALAKCKPLPKETTYFLRRMGETLGLFDLDGQLSQIQKIRLEAQQVLSQLEKNKWEKTKYYKTISLCGGAALAILFI